MEEFMEPSGNEENIPETGGELNEKSGKKRGHRGLWVALIVVVLLAAGAVFVWVKCPVKKVYVQGTSYYTSEEIAEQVIPRDKPLYHNSVFLMIRYYLPGAPSIPFEEKVRVRMLDAETVLITVRDKELAGYIPYVGKNLYFDADGVVREYTPLTVRGITYVTGLDVSDAQPGRRIESEDDAVLGLVLEALQAMRKYEISADGIQVERAGTLSLYFDKVRIRIGRSDYELKISKIAQILPYLEGRSGTIDLTNYSSSDENIILK